MVERKLKFGFDCFKSSLLTSIIDETSLHRPDGQLLSEPQIESKIQKSR